MIICDGGDKPAEQRQIANPGDLILAHNYACDRDHSHREMLGKRWEWCEITDVDWQPLRDLRTLLREDLEQAAWLATEVRNLGERVSEIQSSFHLNTEPKAQPQRSFPNDSAFPRPSSGREC